MSKPNCLMIGTGEYTTGFVRTGATTSDKSAGVIALTLFDLRRQGRVDRLSMAGTNGTRFPGIRDHLAEVIGRTYRDLDVACATFPADDVTNDPYAYRTALATLGRGDLAIVFTPDDTHFPIAMDVIERGCHVLVAKPIVKTLAEHRQLVQAADEKGVLVAMEVHKRWDPIYADARDRIRELGDMSYFTSYMSQPKSQLETFRSWAGQASDISYYLNAHHIDFSVWSLADRARPVSVVASASTGYARGMGIDTEDTITLLVVWESASGNLATATYTASWIAPRSDVHSQQRFFCMGHRGEVAVDQAHRGYTASVDSEGFASPNPLFMKYRPDAAGRFAGQQGYGYRSVAAFVDAVTEIREGTATASDFRDRLATAADTVYVTAILEAGRRSLDDGGTRQEFEYQQGRLIEIRAAR